MIALLDYGAGNLKSVHKALAAAGADVEVLQHPDRIRESRGVVLPGVGAFDDCLSALQRQDLLAGVKDSIMAGRPFLGICVGYQALFERSEEFHSCAAGLGIFKGRVRRFPATPGLKIPQIGWNQVHLSLPNNPLFLGIPDHAYFYFVHSYFPEPEEASIVASRTDHGVFFASSVWSGHVFATQFHPEKSQSMGLRVLKNFLDFCQSA
ncbi:MAG: imidazole glycerol phosphate synthase subunit HisH [Verrucomicrobia bacterium]|nr:imidazole glycerol phosphate synthase subunit HisH [Verrucomicrobiota bacterium]